MKPKYKEPNRKRNERLSIRLTENEKIKFYELAEKNNMTGTDFLLFMMQKQEDEINGLHSK